MSRTRFREPWVILFSADAERASAFYHSLGFREVFRVPTDGEPIQVDLELDGYRLGFASIGSARTHHGVGPKAIRTLAEHLERRGMSFGHR